MATTDPIVIVIEETKEHANLSVRKLMGSIKPFEQRLSRRSEKSIESVFQSKLNVSSKNQEKDPSSFDRSKDESSRASRPDIMFATSLLSPFMHKPSQTHFGAAKRVLRYIQDTLDFGNLYEKNADAKFLGFCDSDWTGCVDDMRSTFGYASSLGSGAFSWSSKKQQTVTQSSTEAEYISASLEASQAYG
ncbi:secreted RxLR effector protein 161-like [Cornus florida]|uniref:secreted RxLR effector protein 161-like n=1 Tax=Cornus florida TaxID=4283 RepID=UPI00289D96B9|nr:secreted RxLR effector protein 161-like [Cornus florida]